MAQQANSRGAVQIHFRVQAAALGEDEGQLSRHLIELGEVGLIQVSRGNVSKEDIRVFFPPHPWIAGIEQLHQAVTPRHTASEAAAPARVFPEAAPPTPASLQAPRPVGAAEVRPGGRGRGRGKGRRQPQSKHAFEAFLGSSGLTCPALTVSRMMRDS
jgi:hypothetical protein